MPDISHTAKLQVAIIDANVLSMLGLKQLLQYVMPGMKVDTFMSFSELTRNDAEQYAHYFVAVNILVENGAFFNEHKRKTIVLSPSADDSRVADYHCLHVNQPEQPLIHSLLALQQHAHSHGRNLPHNAMAGFGQVLTRREIEVLSLIVQGHINKEVADKLHISLSTVITHRKNIIEKLGMKSVSALTIYAVTHGYVDITALRY
jgi:DNA-binding NarL/FixJ family response regulator